MLLLGLATLLVAAALMAVVWRLIRDYQRLVLTTKTLLIGGLIIFGLFGLLLSCLQTLFESAGR